LQDLTGLDTRLGEVTGFGLGDADGLARAERHLQGAVAVGLSVLTWVTRLFDTSSTVTGMASPSSVKMRIMPTLRPSKAEALLRLMVFSSPRRAFVSLPTSIGRGAEFCCDLAGPCGAGRMQPRWACQSPFRESREYSSLAGRPQSKLPLTAA
jgi:hypothetical protein